MCVGGVLIDYPVGGLCGVSALFVVCVFVCVVVRWLVLLRNILLRCVWGVGVCVCGCVVV